MKRNMDIAFCNIMLISSPLITTQASDYHNIPRRMQQEFRYKNANPFIRKCYRLCFYMYFAFIIINA